MKQTSPYTHQDFANAPAGIRSFCQVQKGRVTFCGQIIDAVTTADGRDLWMVDTQIGVVWVTPKNTRACGGFDCSCAHAVCKVSEVLQ